MSSDRRDDAVAFDRLVAEYLNELEQRLNGLPVLQRRELLSDLEAHIVNERAERGVTSEVELLAVLERLGAPEVVAAAAYEEAGLPEPTVQLTPVGAAPRAGGGTVTAAAAARFTGRAERTAAVDSADVIARVAATQYAPGRATVNASPASRASASAASAASPASGAPAVSPASGAPAVSPASGAPAASAAFGAPAASPASGAPVSSPAAGLSAPPAWAPPAPTPEPYTPPAPAKVVPPPDDVLHSRPGPFPPSGPGGFSAVSVPPGGQGFSSGPGAGRRSDGGPPPFVGGPPFPPPPRRAAPLGNPWLRAALGGAIGLVVLFVLGCLGAGMFLVQGGESGEAPAAVVEQAPAEVPIEPVDPPEPPEPPVPLPTE